MRWRMPRRLERLGLWFLAFIAQSYDAQLEKIAAGRLSKFYEEACLLSQESMISAARGDKKKITDLVKSLGKNAAITSFLRFKVGAK